MNLNTVPALVATLLFAQVRVGYDLWDKFDADEFVGKFAPAVVPILLLNGDTDQAVDNDANAQQSARFYGLFPLAPHRAMGEKYRLCCATVGYHYAGTA